MKVDGGKQTALRAFLSNRVYVVFLIITVILTAAVIWQECRIADLQARMVEQEAGNYGTHIGSLYWHAEVTDEKMKEIQKDIFRLQKHSVEHDWALQEKNW